MAFSYYRTVTVDQTKVPSDLTDFPILVSFTHNDLRTVGNGGHVQNASGYDIGFFSDAALTTPHKWEMERYNASTGEVIAWVKIAALSGSVDTTVYMGYGDSGISSFQSTATDVWDANFKAVFHLGDGTSLSGDDATSLNHDLTVGNNTTVVAGKVDGGAEFDGTDDYMTNGTGGPPLTGGFTADYAFGNHSWTMWVYVDRVSSTNNFFVERSISSSNTTSYVWWTSNNQYGLGTNKLITGFRNTLGGYNDMPFDWTPSTGTWYFVASTFDGTTQTAYINASSIGTATPGQTPGLQDAALMIGRQGATNASPDELDGRLDEVRFSNTNRSADWITTEYNTMNDPASFFTLGSEQSTASGSGPLLRSRLLNSNLLYPKLVGA